MHKSHKKTGFLLNNRDKETKNFSISPFPKNKSLTDKKINKGNAAKTI